MKTPRESGLISPASEALKEHNQRRLKSVNGEIEIPIDFTEEQLRLARESGFVPIFVLEE